MGIPVVAIVDTNCDPDLVDWVIPGQRRRVARDSPVHFENFRRGACRAPVLRADRRSPIRRRPKAAGEEGVDYVDTSAYEVYEKQEGDFVEGEPGEAATEEAAAQPC